MYLKRNVIEVLTESGITRFILIGDNIMNFHSSDDCYYQEWFEEIEDGWIACVDFYKHVIDEFEKIKIHYYLTMGPELEIINWRTYSPTRLFEIVSSKIIKKIGN